MNRIELERGRQVLEEGWTPEHDAQHKDGELEKAARCYAMAGICAQTSVPKSWPWDKSWWKPSSDGVRNLEKAGALFLAEQHRLVACGKDEGYDLMRTEVRLAADRIDVLLQERPAE